MARPTVPKFGNWENEEEPYTVYFDQARKNKGGKMINPNDPQQYPEMFAGTVAHSAAATKPRVRPEEPVRRGGVRNENTGSRGRVSNNSLRPLRQSAGSDQSFEKSPLHPQQRAKVSGRGGSPYDSSHGGGGRSRMKPESPNNAAIPRFGEWDDINPQSADNYTEIFNQVRHQRHQDSANASRTPTRPSYTTQKQKQRAQKCCLWW